MPVTATVKRMRFGESSCGGGRALRLSSLSAALASLQIKVFIGRANKQRNKKIKALLGMANM